MYIYEVMVDVIHLDIYGDFLGNPYMWGKDGIYYRILNKLIFVKDGKVFLASAHEIQKIVTLGHCRLV